MLAGLLLAVASRVSTAQCTLAFTRVNVIDGSSPSERREQTVVIHGNRIVDVVPSRSWPVSHCTRVVDGRGKFLIPGFWDMHVHTDVVRGRDVLALYVANGVT